MCLNALIIAPIFRYPDFSMGLVLETDTLLKGLEALWSQQGDDSKLCVIAYVSRTLCPLRRSMYIYTSAKLKLLTLKWAINEKFCDYKLGHKFHVFIANNSFTYMQESELDVS